MATSTTAQTKKLPVHLLLEMMLGLLFQFDQSNQLPNRALAHTHTGGEMSREYFTAVFKISDPAKFM